MWKAEFSNFYLPAEHPGIIKDFIVYPTVEHFFVAMKSMSNKDRLMVAALGHPAEAKKIGKSLALRPDWKRVRVSVLKYGLRQKWRWQPLKEMLLATGYEPIVHQVHWHDNFWSECVCAKCTQRDQHNMLGVLLMKIRTELAEETPFVYRSNVYHGTPLKVPV